MSYGKIIYLILLGGARNFHVKTARTLEEIIEPWEVSFEYTCQVGVVLLRKRK